MTSLPRFAPGAVFAGDFVVERRLAEGGMGAVYVVEQRSTGHRRALKVMHPDIVADARNRERFTQEARVGSLIRSPYVVEVAAAGVDDATGTPWLLMELLEGENLRERVTRRALPDRSMLREMFEQLGDALGRAHAAGVVHRDLKPENLFIAVSRIRNVPFLMKVLDFGIAAIVSGRKDSATVTTVIGSPMWMAPEQASVGAQVGPPADVWSLGLIAFYAMTGRYFWPSLTGPKDHVNLAALLVDVVVHPIPAPSARAEALGVAASLPAGFDAWFARCVTRDPAQRFPEAHAAVDALLPLLAEGPRRPSRPRRSVAPVASTAPSLMAASPLFATASSPPAPPHPDDPPVPSDTLVTPGFTVPGAPASTPSRRGPALAALAAVALLGVGVAAVALRGGRATPVTPPATVARDAAPPRGGRRGRDGRRGGRCDARGDDGRGGHGGGGRGGGSRGAVGAIGRATRRRRGTRRWRRGMRRWRRGTRRWRRATRRWRRTRGCPTARRARRSRRRSGTWRWPRARAASRAACSCSRTSLATATCSPPAPSASTRTRPRASASPARCGRCGCRRSAGRPSWCRSRSTCELLSQGSPGLDRWAREGSPWARSMGSSARWRIQGSMRSVNRRTSPTTLAAEPGTDRAIPCCEPCPLVSISSRIRLPARGAQGSPDVDRWAREGSPWASSMPT